MIGHRRKAVTRDQIRWSSDKLKLDCAPVMVAVMRGYGDVVLWVHA